MKSVMSDIDLSKPDLCDSFAFFYSICDVVEFCILSVLLFRSDEVDYSFVFVVFGFLVVMPYAEVIL